MNYEVETMKQRISIIIHAFAGILIGYVSIMLNNAWYSVGLAVAVLLVIGYGVEFLIRKKGIKWWLGNGGVLYLLFWVVSWVLFYNYTVVSVVV